MTMLDPNFDPFAGLDVDANPGAYFVMPTLWADMDAWHERVAQLRNETPIVPVDIPNFKKFWVLTRHKDIFEIERQPDKAVLVCQHDYVPKTQRKFLGQVQTKYPRKNWSSLMLFNNARCRALTPDYVNQASGLELHQFKWLDSDDLIGALPDAWNHLVGYNPPRDDAALVHFTLGGPYFPQYKDCEYAKAWFAERDAMLHAGRRPG